jgi:hypothetical protein
MVPDVVRLSRSPTVVTELRTVQVPRLRLRLAQE